MTRSLVLVAVLSATTATVSLSAHEFWSVATLHAAQSGVVTVAGNIGERFSRRRYRDNARSR